MDEFRYTLSRQLHKQSPITLLGPEEVAEMVPFMNMDNIHGGLFTPNEVTSPDILPDILRTENVISRATLTRTA